MSATTPTPTSSCLAGYVDRSGRFVVPPRFGAALAPASGILRVQPFGDYRWSALAPDGRVLFAGAAAIAEPVDGCAAFNVDGVPDGDDVDGGLWGVVARRGVTVPARWTGMGTIAEGLAPVSDERGAGFVDVVTGAEVVPPRWSRTAAVGGGLLRVRDDDERWGLLDRTGQVVVAPRFASLLLPSFGRVVAETDDGWVLVDRAGAPVSKVYDDMDNICGGLARVHKKGRQGVIDMAGRVVGKRWFEEITDWEAGLAIGVEDDQHYVLTRAGEVHGPFDGAALPKPGELPLAIVSTGGKIGFVGLEGVVVAPRWDRARTFVDGVATARRDGRWTLLDATGKELCDPAWDAVGDPGSGVVPVRRDGRWGLVDHAAREVLAPTFDTLGRFVDGLAVARRVAWSERAPALPPRVVVTPAGGLSDPWLADDGPAGSLADHDLRVAVAFREEIEVPRATGLRHVCEGLLAAVEGRHGDEAIVDGSRYIAPYAVTFRLHAVPDARAIAATFLAEVAALDLDPIEVVLARFSPTPEGTPGPGWAAVPHPLDPRGPDELDDHDALLALACDPSATPPRSEVPMKLGGRWVGDDLVVEERLATLHDPRVRIFGGVLTDGFDLAADEAAAPDVAEALARADHLCERLDARFAEVFAHTRLWSHPKVHRVLPDCRDVRGNNAVMVGAFETGGRRRFGWAFCVRTPTLLMDLAPRVYRFREPELMAAIADVVADAPWLEPVIGWTRFGRRLGVLNDHTVEDPGIVLVNLWSRPV